jgi:hypothetical protein
MRVDIKDRSALISVRPSDIASYLRSRGWTEHGAQNGAWATFIRDDVEIAIPLTTNLVDFPQRMADALHTLELVEERDQTEILADLSLTSDDVVRIRIADVEARDGTLSLERASRVVSRTYDLMLAAACAAVEPKLYYPSRKPQKAMDYMRNIRMGQTERGSFVIAALSRVSPELMPADEASALGIPEPFERQVTEMLACALGAASEAASTRSPVGLDSSKGGIPGSQRESVRCHRRNGAVRGAMARRRDRHVMGTKSTDARNPSEPLSGHRGHGPRPSGDSASIQVEVTSRRLRTLWTRSPIESGPRRSRRRGYDCGADR